MYKYSETMNRSKGKGKEIIVKCPDCGKDGVLIQKGEDEYYVEHDEDYEKEAA